jgi:hypothetical protein
VFEVNEVQHWEDVALAIGRYSVQVSGRPGTVLVDRRKYVGHWRRMTDGHLRVTLSIWYSDRWDRPTQP